MITRVLIQARMTSERFPGKVLAPFLGKPVIAHLIERVARAVPLDTIVLATSDQESDDPLAGYVERLGVAVFRGDLRNVFARFQQCLGRHPCEHFIRLCGDSPLMDTQLIRRFAGLSRLGVDLVTNVQKRTFPKGHSVELLKTNRFASIDAKQLSEEHREHVTAVYYAHPERFSIVNVEAEKANLGGVSYVVDTIEDLRRLETLCPSAMRSADRAGIDGQTCSP